MEWIFTISPLPLGLLITTLFVAVGVVGMWLTHRLIYDRPLRGTHGLDPDAYELLYDQLMKS